MARRMAELVVGPVAEARPLGAGHINETFLVATPAGEYVAQRLNTAVFPDPGAVTANIVAVHRHLRGALMPEPVPGSGGEWLAWDGAEELVIEATYDGPRRDVSLFGKWFGSGVEQDGRAQKWCTEILGQPATLVRVPPDHVRPGWGVHAGKAAFADAHALLVTSLSSLDELNARILETGGDPVPMNRFRPNVVVGGWSEPHTEDKVLEATIGAVRIGYSARSIRCAVPRIDQATGERMGPEPTKTLSTYRRQPDYDGGASFGMKAAVLIPGRIAVDDEFHVDACLPEGEDPGAIAHNQRPGVRQG